MSVASESCSIKTPGYDPSVNTEFSHSVAPRHFGAMNLLCSCVVLLALARVAAQATEPMLTLPTETATFSIDSGGSIAAISRSDNGQNYLATGQAAPVLSIRTSGKLNAPSEATWEADARRLTLRYKSAGVRVVLSVAAHPAYIVLQVVEIQPAEQVELVLWGPYPTTIGEIIGETVGVVRNREFAIGIQALNVKTLGGYPKDENDAEGESSGDDQGSYPDLPAEVLKGQHFRTDTARRTEFGSVLQAYCRNRLHDQVIPNWAHPKYRVPGLSRRRSAGKPHRTFCLPERTGAGAHQRYRSSGGIGSPDDRRHLGQNVSGATASYLIVDFSEANVDRAIEMTRRAGLKYLYHSSPFETWGHFKLKPNLFPNGWDGLRTCVEKARLAGIRAGVHTLSNFITPNDDYVTRKPDPRLAQIGASELVSEVDAAQNEIPVLAPDYFTNKSALNTVSVGEELIRFGTISTQAPWRLLKCERGAWGTRAAPHPKGEAVARLLDHEYKVFLATRISRRKSPAISPLCSIRQACCKPHSMAWKAIGPLAMGNIGCALFTKAWFDALDPQLRGHVINDASLPGHFNWHINTRMNWGEPWYGSFRESQTLYRFKNQVYFERNLMPHMLGWFALRPDTSIEDAEWLLARAAGFKAGFALATSLASTAQLAADPSSADAAKRFGATPAILEAIRQWETARMADAFPRIPQNRPA